MAIGFSNWQEFGVDPISLGQPVIYINGNNPNFLAGSGGTGNLQSNEHIWGINRYNDNGLNFGRTSDTNRAAWANNASLNGSAIAWFGNLLTTGGAYTTGDTSTLAFMNQSGTCEFTVYWMFKNRPNENQGTTKIQLATSNTSGNRGIQFSLLGALNPGIRTIRMTILNNTAGQSAVVSNAYSFQSDDVLDWKLFSWRVNAIGLTSGIIGSVYVDGKKVDDVTITNPLAGNGSSSNAPFIGNRQSGNLRYAAYLGEFIIFNKQHSEATHLKICNHLRKKWKT